MITLFHDVTSPASAVAVARADRLARDGVAIECVGFEAIGVDVDLPVTIDVLAELDVVADAAAAEGVVLHAPTRLPPTGLVHVVSARLEAVGAEAGDEGPSATALAGDHADPSGAAVAWRGATYAAFWRDGADVGDPGALTALAGDAGLDADAAAALLADRLALAALRRATTERRRDGVGGVPTLLAQRTLVPGLLDDDTLRSLAAL